MKFKNYPYIAFVAIFALSACKKLRTDPIIGPDIYFAGAVNYGNSQLTATYWKNSQQHLIAKVTDNVGSAAYSIAVQGNNVYAAGYYVINSMSMATYWKNGVAVKLDSLESSEATGIAVQGNDVYVAGYKTAAVPFPNRIRYQAVYWKNGVEMPVDNTRGSVVIAMAVQGGDVYLAGYTYLDSGAQVPTYWKNGVATQLSNGNMQDSEAFGIAIAGNDIYIVGENEYKATLWKNGVASMLPDTVGHSEANSIAIDGANIYIAGAINGTLWATTYGDVIAYWKNGVLNKFTSDARPSVLTTINVTGNDIYVGGQTTDVHGYGVATYWKNGVMVPLTTKPSFVLASTIVNH